MGSRIVLLATLTLALTAATPAMAAAPRLIMVSGAPLERPVLLSDWDEAAELYWSFFFDGTAADPASLEGRPSLRLGLFWNSHVWEPYVRQDRLGELRPEQANQVGRFYPAVGDKPALVDVPGYGQWPKIADVHALKILERHGVPVQLVLRARESSAGWDWWRWAAIGSGAAMVVAIVLRRSRLRRTL
jgi:hypothetical protein